MLLGDTDPVNRRSVVVAAIVAVGVIAAGTWLFAGDWVTRTAGRAGESLRELTDRSSAPNQSELVGAPTAATRAVGSPAAATDASGDQSRADANLDTTLVLADGEVLISYPPGFGLAVTQEQLLHDAQIPPCDEGFDYCIYVEPEEFEGTNFSSAGLGIQARTDLTNEADCMLTQPDGYLDLVPIVAGASDFATTLYHGIDQGAAGHYSTGSLGRLYYDSACYQFETRVAQAQFANYPTGTIEEFDAADQARTSDRLMAVMARVALPDGRNSLWGRAPSRAGSGDGPTSASSTAPLPHLFEPESGASVGSPLRLVGEAPGPWFFEASFPYRLITAAGEVIATGAATTEGDWMTEELVPFEAIIEFTVSEPTDAVLHLMKDNPSALEENDASIEVPLHLLP